MKFFIPGVPPKEQEAAYAAMKGRVSGSPGWEATDRRIYSVDYTHNGVPGRAEVGKHDPLSEELVLAIFESRTYLVCTPTRGGNGGEPRLVGRPEVQSVAEFEP
jgi:hypothetical protein